MEEQYGTSTRKHTSIGSKESNDKQKDSHDYRKLQVMGRRECLWMKLELQEPKERRTSQKLIFLYKVVEGLVPAIESDDYLKKARPKRSGYHC